jgi:hypothetical protein
MKSFDIQFQLAIAIAIAQVALPSYGAATGDSDVGWVIEYSPPEAVHTIIRTASNTSVRLKLGTAVYANDTVQMSTAGRVVIALADGTERQVDGPGNWRVPNSEAPSRIWQVLGSVLQLGEKQAQLAASAATRGNEECMPGKSFQPDPIRVPILRVRSHVTAGVQSLAIGWYGGCPPFDVSLESPTRVVARASSLTKRFQQFSDVDLVVGAYRVQIQDKAGVSVNHVLAVVAEGPPSPTEFTKNNATAGVLARALWLADVDGGAWRLESIKTLRPLLLQRQPVAIRMADYLMSTDDAVLTPAPPSSR